MLQHIRSNGSAEGVSDDYNLIEVVCSKDLRDRETGGLSIKRGASYSITDWEHLAESLTIGKCTQKGMRIPPQ